MVEVVRQIHHHTEAEHFLDLGFGVGCHLLENVDGSSVINDVGHHQLGFHVGHIVNGLHRCLVFLFVIRGSQFDERHFRVFPNLEELMQASAHIVVGRGAPEVRTQSAALAQKVVAVCLILLQKTCRLVEFDVEIVVPNGDFV